METSRNPGERPTRLEHRSSPSGLVISFTRACTPRSTLALFYSRAPSIILFARKQAASRSFRFTRDRVSLDWTGFIEKFFASACLGTLSSSQDLGRHRAFFVFECSSTSTIRIYFTGRLRVEYNWNTRLFEHRSNLIRTLERNSNPSGTLDDSNVI